MRFRPAVGAMFCLLLVAGCGGQRDASDADVWRKVLTRALTELRQQDPDSAKQLERLVREAETAEAAATGRASSDRASQAWLTAMNAAADEVNRLRRARSETEARLAEQLSAARSEVALAERRALEAGSSRDHAGAVQAARLRLSLAERLAGSGDLNGATTAADDAIALADAAQAGWRWQRDRVADPELRARWMRQVSETVDRSKSLGNAAVIVNKAGRRLHVYRRGRQVAVFSAEIGTAGLAPKRHAGDRATPEGTYRVVTVKTGGATRYYKALLLDYPNGDDRRRYELAREEGTIPEGVGPGSLIEIHGHGGRGRDWTEGCVALRDEDMDRLLEMVAVGTPVTIVGWME